MRSSVLLRQYREHRVQHSGLDRSMQADSNTTRPLDLEMAARRSGAADTARVRDFETAVCELRVATIVGVVTSTGSSFAAGSRLASSKPCLYNRRQPNSRFAFNSYLRAITATDAPRTNVSSTIRRFSASVRIRRRGTVPCSETIACPYVSI